MENTSAGESSFSNSTVTTGEYLSCPNPVPKPTAALVNDFILLESFFDETWDIKLLDSFVDMFNDKLDALVCIVPFKSAFVNVIDGLQE